MIRAVRSQDGTNIAYSQSGSGPPVVFIGGPLNDRGGLAQVAHHLASRFTTVTYDRRGRGDSGDTPPYDIEREVEDLVAVTSAIGGVASAFGFSSGATLALIAAAHGFEFSSLALYETAFPVNDGGWVTKDLPERLNALIAADRPGDAVSLFRIHADMLAEALPLTIAPPSWSELMRMARTCVYDATLTRPGVLDESQLSVVVTPALVMTGTATAPTLQWGGRVVAEALSNGQYVPVPGNHDLEPAALAERVAEFLSHGQHISR